MIKSLCVLVTASLMLVGCDRSQGTAPVSETATASSRSVKSGNARDASRAEFLNRIRAADPRYQTIERALLNEQNELGIILKRDVDLNDIPPLMRSLLTQMAKEFPGEDLTVIAYTPTEPPMQIGTGRLNAATREMTYTPTTQRR
jgi:hypothetical protein